MLSYLVTPPSAASDLSLLAMNASDTQVEEVVAAFSQQLKRKVKSVSELPGSGQDALLRRASQGTELSKLVANFVKLPEATRNKVVDMQFGRLLRLWFEDFVLSAATPQSSVE